METSQSKVMLGLKMPTDPRWVNIAERDIEAILTDHAYCEQKAATNAISIIVKFPEYTDVVDAMVKLCNEEMTHFGMVHDELKKRGLKLGSERKDQYVNDLKSYIMRGGSRQEQFVDRMLFAAMIEARSCERFRLLSLHIGDLSLRDFYRNLMESEAAHYTMFITFARKYAGNTDVNQRWKEFLEFEAELMKTYGKKQTIHG